MRCCFLVSRVHCPQPRLTMRPMAPYHLQTTPLYSQELMEDPVVAADGFTYERAAIADWLTRGNATSPMTGAALESTALLQNLAVRSAAALFKRHGG